MNDEISAGMAPESLVVPQAGTGVGYDDNEWQSETGSDFELYQEIIARLNVLQEAQLVQAKTLEALTNGVNTIGEMMNSVAGAFDQIMEQVQKGGLASLLGGMMGSKKE